LSQYSHVDGASDMYGDIELNKKINDSVLIISHTGSSWCSGYANPERRSRLGEITFLGQIALLAWFHGETARHAILRQNAVKVDVRSFIVQQQTRSNQQNSMTQYGGASEQQPLNERDSEEVGHYFPRRCRACALMSRQPEITVWRIR